MYPFSTFTPLAADVDDMQDWYPETHRMSQLKDERRLSETLRSGQSHLCTFLSVSGSDACPAAESVLACPTARSNPTAVTAEAALIELRVFPGAIVRREPEKVDAPHDEVVAAFSS
jgi:hypothetical protein